MLYVLVLDIRCNRSPVQLDSTRHAVTRQAQVRHAYINTKAPETQVQKKRGGVVCVGRVASNYLTYET